MSKETLEEAAEIYVWGGIYLNEAEKQQTEIAFIAGAKWQQERMYSEEQVIAIVEKSRATGLTAEYIIESLKQGGKQ